MMAPMLKGFFARSTAMRVEAVRGAERSIPASASVAAVGIRANRMTRRFLILLSVLSVFVPAGLQLVGWLPASYAFADGQMRILPAATYLPAVPTLTFLVSAILLQVVVTQLLVGIGVERLVLAERRNFAQAWRLRHLLPADSGA